MLNYEQSVLKLLARGDKVFAEKNYFDEDIKAAAERFLHSEEFREVRLLINQHARGSKLLDIGSGHGISAYAFSRSGFQVTAVEPDPSPIVGRAAILQLLERDPGLTIHLIDAFAENLPCAPASFDTAYCRQVLHHFNDLTLGLTRIRESLKPGGCFLATREHVIKNRDELPVFLEHHPLHHLHGGENAYTLESYLKAFRDAGFRSVRVIDLYDSPINYFPLTQEDLLKDLRQRCSHKWKRLGQLPLTCFRPFLKPFTRYLNRYAAYPGKMCSFLAVR